MYTEVFTQSWKDLKENPILFVPDIVIVVINIILGLSFLKSSGLITILSDPSTILKSLETFAPILQSFLKENLIRVIVTLILFAITSFVIGSGLSAMKYGMLRDLVNKKKLTLSKMWENGKNIWLVVSMKMIMFAVGIITLLFLIGSGVIMSQFIERGTAAFILTVATPIFILILQLLLFFRYQIMFLENKHPFEAIKESYHYFTKHFKTVILTWLIIIAISITASFLAAFTGLAEGKLTFSITLILGYLVRNIINVIIGLWAETFKFRIYKLKA